MFYSHPFGGLISIFTPTVYEGQLGLTLDMQIDPFLRMLYTRMYCSLKQMVKKMPHIVSSHHYCPAKFFLHWPKLSGGQIPHTDLRNTLKKQYYRCTCWEKKTCQCATVRYTKDKSTHRALIIERESVRALIDFSLRQARTHTEMQK